MLGACGNEPIEEAASDETNGTVSATTSFTATVASQTGADTGDSATTATTADTTAATESGTSGSDSTDGTTGGTDTDGTGTTSATDATTGEGTTTVTTGDATTGDATGGTTGGIVGDLDCIDVEIGSVVRQTYVGDNSLAGDGFDPGCTAAAEPNGPDVGHRFVAPEDGWYAFDTLGAIEFDTVLYAMRDGCASALPWCNDDAALGEPGSWIGLWLAADAVAVVVVDGWQAGEEGSYALQVEQTQAGACAATDLGAGATPVASGEVAVEVDKITTSCAELLGGPDVVLQWQAPADDTWRLRTVGSSYDTVLAVYDGVCGTLELGCNDDGVDLGTASQLDLPLVAGQTVTIVVDGFDDAVSGGWELSIAPAP
jgi:hypothetical protein